MIMIKKLTAIAAAFVFSVATTNAQSTRIRSNGNANERPLSLMQVGLGIGLDYGGLGLKVEFRPVKFVGIFAGAGYNLASLGVNTGLVLRPLPHAKIQPLALAMYGSNASINIDASSHALSALGFENVNKSYYGFSTGIGGELSVGRKGNRLYAAVLLPFRNQEFRDNYDRLKASPAIDITGAVLPVTFSFGFNWSI